MVVRLECVGCTAPLIPAAAKAREVAAHRCQCLSLPSSSTCHAPSVEGVPAFPRAATDPAVQSRIPDRQPPSSLVAIAERGRLFAPGAARRSRRRRTCPHESLPLRGPVGCLRQITDDVDLFVPGERQVGPTGTWVPGELWNVGIIGILFAVCVQKPWQPAGEVKPLVSRRRRIEA